MRANFIFSEVWIGLRRNLTMTLAVVLTVAVGMAMLGVGLLINAQVSMMKDYWYDRVEVSVFLCHKNTAMPQCGGKGVSDAQVKALDAKLKAIPGVAAVTYEDQETALKNFKATLDPDNVMAQTTKVEDMPTSFRLKLADPDSNYKPIVDAAKALPGVASVKDQREIVNGLFDMLDTLRSAALIVAGTLVAAAALLIGNTVRLSAFNRRRETGIMRLVGASNIYIQLPFVMEGVIAGLIGGVGAAVMLIMSKVFLFDGLAGHFANQPLGWDEVAGAITKTMVIGVFICVLASFVTLRRYLRV
ncbi:permease-like cell division protein FtsX [Nonomuraea sp. NPDC047897]|jgi:cell division transport system permease protein|uniref:permease-like cell division protein FtsX n=1 Tax=Nonomuraea sp. NPDC047897 TaxID=3364346 RepID=UPI00370FACDB